MFLSRFARLSGLTPPRSSALRIPRRGRSLALALSLVVAAQLVVPAALPGAASASPAGAITVTDIAGRMVTVNAPVQRILLGEARLMYMLAALDTEDPFGRVVGWSDDLRITDLDAYQRYGEAFPKMFEIPVLGTPQSGSFSAEKAIDLQPDVVLMTVDNFSQAVQSGPVEVLARAGIPTVVIDFRQDMLGTTVPSALLLGRLIGKEERAQQFADFYQQQVDVVLSRVAQMQLAEPSVFLFRVASPAECCPSFGRSTLGLLIEKAGGTNIAVGQIPGHSGVLNPEYVLNTDPDVIIATGSNWTHSPTIQAGYVSLGYGADRAVAREQLRNLTTLPGWTGLKAVQNNRLHAVWHQFYTSPTHFAALQQFAKWIHPEQFADLDPESRLRELHERFLPIPYSGTFWVSVTD